jgi:hypothetical protein
MKALCQSARDRGIVMRQLLESASVAEREAPLSWSVTLRPDSFRMNVGGVEALTFGAGVVRLLLHGEASAFESVDVEPIQYKSVPSPQAVAFLTPKALSQCSQVVREAHRKFIQLAAILPSGKPARSKFAKSHSAGLYAYAQQCAERAT